MAHTKTLQVTYAEPIIVSAPVAAETVISSLVFKDSSGEFDFPSANGSDPVMVVTETLSRPDKGAYDTYSNDDGVLDADETADAHYGRPGEVISVWLADGENASYGSYLSHAGSGQVQVYTGTAQAVDEAGDATYTITTGLQVAKLRAEEAVNNTTGGAPARILARVL